MQTFQEETIQPFSQMTEPVDMDEIIHRINKGVYHDQDRSWIVLQRTQQPLNTLSSYVSYASQLHPISRQVAP